MTDKERQFINDIFLNRKRIYELMLIEYKNSTSVFGFCWAFELVLRKEYNLEFYLVMCNISNILPINNLPELMEYKPKGRILEYDAWYPLNEKGKQKRIKILKEIISKLQ